MPSIIRLQLILILVVYLGLGIAYAVYTPTWQIPDEPAHYNYIAHLANTGRLPVLNPGDYPFEYLEQIKHEKFPPSMPVDPIRYESWQPPLYYGLATPVFVLTKGLPQAQQVIAIRLLSVLLGMVLVFLSFKIVTAIFPEDLTLALATSVLVGFIPMHLTMAAAVNNDVLAEGIIAGILLVSILRLNQSLSTRSFILSGGLLYGLGLLTKGTVYPAAAILLATEWIYQRRLRQAPFSALFRSMGMLFLISLALSAWWFVRNAVVYGGLDIFGRQRHDAVVQGQVRTGDWIASNGWAAYWDRDWNFTFKSFWGVFGWMGVFMDQRIYTGLLLLTLIAIVGLAVFAIRRLRDPNRVSPLQKAALGILALQLLLTAGTYVWYNLTFMQHQGRYFFPALIPIALFIMLGYRELIPRIFWPLVPMAMLGGMTLFNLISLKWFVIPNL